MSKDFANESIDSINAAAQAGQQLQVELDDREADTSYSSNARVSGSAEEIVVEFAGPIRAIGPNKAGLKIDHRIILSPWAAKRLAISLGQAVTRYEQSYGPLEIDPRKRNVGASNA